MLATPPGEERVALSAGTGAGGAISSQSVTLVACVGSGEVSLVAVTFSTEVPPWTASGAEAMG